MGVPGIESHWLKDYIFKHDVCYQKQMIWSHAEVRKMLHKKCTKNGQPIKMPESCHASDLFVGIVKFVCLVVCRSSCLFQTWMNLAMFGWMLLSLAFSLCPVCWLMTGYQTGREWNTVDCQDCPPFRTYIFPESRETGREHLYRPNTTLDTTCSNCTLKQPETASSHRPSL